MIARVAFAGAFHVREGRVVRRPTFAAATTVPLAVICRVANAAGDRLASLLATDVGLELAEPLRLDSPLRARLFEGAQVVRARGTVLDVFVVVLPEQARRLADAAFARDVGDRVGLSSVESRVVDRLSRTVALECAPLCGQVITVVPEASARAAREAAVYFEMRLLRPFRASIGIALTSEVSGGNSERCSLESLHGVRVRGRAAVGRAKLTLRELSNLAPGAIIAVEASLDDAATLEFGRRVVARGECGVVGDRFAFRVSDVGVASL